MLSHSEVSCCLLWACWSVQEPHHDLRCQMCQVSQLSSNSWQHLCALDKRRDGKWSVHHHHRGIPCGPGGGWTARPGPDSHSCGPDPNTYGSKDTHTCSPGWRNIAGSRRLMFECWAWCHQDGGDKVFGVHVCIRWMMNMKLWMFCPSRVTRFTPKRKTKKMRRQVLSIHSWPWADLILKPSPGKPTWPLSDMLKG